MIRPLIPAAAPHPARRVVSVGNVAFGGSSIPIISGACAVEPGYVEQAREVAAAGASVLRGCVFKPRTRRDSFQGLGEAGLPLIDAAREATGLPVVAEPLGVEDVALLSGRVEAFQIGARSMQNVPLLLAVGRAGAPVILKRGLAATYDEWLAAADYIRGEGNDDVILCERGIRTFETGTRNTLDIAAIAVLRERTDLPVIIDPSHAAGRAALVAPLAMAAVAAGADGLLIECHPDPARSYSDAAQAITPAALRAIVDAVDLLTGAVRGAKDSGLRECREGIDAIDASIARLLERRVELVEMAQGHKVDRGLAVRDTDRERAIVHRVGARAPRLGEAGAARVVEAVVGACLAAVHAEGESDPTAEAEAVPVL